MATKAKEATQEAPEVATKIMETEYTVQEFAKASEKVFGSGITPDIVVAAFMVNHITKATKSEAIGIVEAFAKKEVK